MFHSPRKIEHRLVMPLFVPGCLPGGLHVGYKEKVAPILYEDFALGLGWSSAGNECSQKASGGSAMVTKRPAWYVIFCRAWTAFRVRRIECQPIAPATPCFYRAGLELSQDPREMHVLKTAQWKMPPRLVLNARRPGFDLQAGSQQSILPQGKQQPWAVAAQALRSASKVLADPGNKQLVRKAESRLRERTAERRVDGYTRTGRQTIAARQRCKAQSVLGCLLARGIYRRLINCLPAPLFVRCMVYFAKFGQVTHSLTLRKQGFGSRLLLPPSTLMLV